QSRAKLARPGTAQVHRSLRTNRQSAGRIFRAIAPARGLLSEESNVDRGVSETALIMSEGARIQDIDALRALKRALWKFSEISAAAIADAEGDVQRTMMWLETEQRSHWQHQLRMRHELVNRAKEALRM